MKNYRTGDIILLQCITYYDKLNKLKIILATKKPAQLV